MELYHRSNLNNDEFIFSRKQKDLRNNSVCMVNIYSRKCLISLHNLCQLNHKTVSDIRPVNESDGFSITQL